MSGAGPMEGVVRLSFSDDRMECRATIAGGVDRSELTVSSLLAHLSAKGVVNECVDRAAAEAFISRAVSQPGAEVSGVIARGRQPESGIAGHFEFAADIQTQFDEIARREHVLKHAPPVATTGVSRRTGDDGTDINFYEVSAFVIVRRGAMIGTILEPTPGVAGVDVRGERIPAEAGTPAEFSIGEGLEKVGGTEVRAAIDGRLVRAVGEVRVEDVLRVSGPVDFSTGNIKFPGDVVVTGGLKDRFRIEADGDVEVRELVEAGHIETPFDVTFTTGMTGRDTGTLAIGGSLTARYLDRVTGRVDGVCRVSREMNACDLRLGSDLECGGVVYGGRLRVAGRCEVVQLGGQGGVATEVMLGWVDELEAAASELVRVVDDRVPAGPRPNRPERAAVVALMQTADRVVAAQRNAPGVLTVRKTIYPGVRLVWRGWSAEISTAIEGPMTIELNEDGEPAFRGSPRDEPVPLSRIARVTPSDEMVSLDPILDRLSQAA